MDNDAPPAEVIDDELEQIGHMMADSKGRAPEKLNVSKDQAIDVLEAFTKETNAQVAAVRNRQDE